MDRDGKNIHGWITWMKENLSNISLSNLCLHKEEKEEVVDKLYKYKEALSLRDEVEIDVTDKSPFFIRPYRWVPLKPYIG